MISTVTTTTTTVTSAEIMTYSIIAAVTLIVFLAIKTILSSETENNSTFKSFLSGANVAIIPLVMVFAAVLAYKVVSII